MDFQNTYRQKVQMINHGLEQLLKQCRDCPPSIRKAMEYSLMAGGKRLRPVLFLSSYELACRHSRVEPETDPIRPMACALEMIHTYSLIHDDLPAMDDDDYRRGKPSNHKVFGEGMAVLAGDGLLSYAFETMLAALAAHGGDVGYLCAVQAVAEGAGVGGMVAGQAVDLEAEREAKVDADTLEYIHAHKTGAMIKAAVVAGAHIAHADAAQLSAIGAFGSLYGLLFQITDDVLDVSGSFAGMGKTLGKDQAAHKLTYVSLYGLEAARRVAADTARRAKEALAIFGQAAEYFIELTEATLQRDH